MKAGSKRREADILLSDEAIDWLVKLQSGRATHADQAAFAKWRQMSDEHELAAQEAEAVWHGVGLAGDQVREDERKAARVTLTRRAVLGVSVLAAMGLGIGTSGLIGPGLFADHVSDAGDQRKIALADGSAVILNGRTSLSVDFTATERRLRLFAGEATFTVARDAGRPFIVEANGGRTRAVGTVFNIDIRSEDVVVTVLEGVVEVSTDADAVTAKADQRVRYASHGRPSAAEEVDADVETAWRRGKLIVNRRPLGDIVAEIERHRRGPILIANARLRSLEVTGVFDLAEPDGILRTIEETLPLRITRLPFVTIIR